MNKKYIQVCVKGLCKDYSKELDKVSYYDLKAMANRQLTWNTQSMSTDMKDSLRTKYAVEDKDMINMVIALIVRKTIIERFRSRTKIKEQMTYRNHLKMYGL